MVRILGFHCHGLGSVPDRGSEILQGLAKKQTNKQKEFFKLPGAIACNILDLISWYYLL